MTLHISNTEQIEIVVDDNSYRNRTIMGDNTLTIYYSLSEHIEVPVGAWVEFDGQRYELMQPENIKKQGTRKFEYTLILDAEQAKLKKYRFRDTTSRRLKFDYTAQPQEHLQMLVDNMNQREEGWMAGYCIQAVEQVISYNHNSCQEALSAMADAFNTEWEVVGKTINLRKVEYNKNSPLPLSYGRGNGFLPGVGRINFDGENPCEVLFVQGGERNIDPSRYGSRELLLPKGQKLEYEGRTYITDEDGFSLRRFDKELHIGTEDSLDCSHIYPSRVGTVSDVEVVDAGNHFYDFFDNSIPNDLDFNNYQIAGEKMTVIFQSGMLAGKEFDIDRYIHAERRFRLVPQELDGRTMPDDIFRPVVGDTYAVFGMMMPSEYISDDTTQTGASWDMFREAAKYLFEHEEQQFTFSGELDSIWAREDWANIGGRILLGGTVLFSDAQFQQEGIPIRIVGIKDYVNNPYKPQLDLSNSITGSTVRSDLRKITQQEVVTESSVRRSVLFTRRSYRSAEETSKALEAALLGFDPVINPVAVKTMQAIVGDSALQFVFVEGIGDPRPIQHDIIFNPIGNQLTIEAGVIQHKTFGIDAISSSHAPEDYHYWALPEVVIGSLDPDKLYYLYAKCDVNTQDGEFYISAIAVGMEEVEGYYHFLIGILNREFDGGRSFARTYGITEILPGQVLTDIIISEDGKTYFNLRDGKIGGNIYFEDGLVSGSVGISGDEGNVNAGLSGEGNTSNSVRIWSGANKANKESAPFRVLQDGTLVATNAKITGEVNATAGVFTNVQVFGSMRSPFIPSQDSFATDHTDNMTIEGGSAGFPLSMVLPGDISQNGRRLVIRSQGYTFLTISTNKSFFYNGFSRTSITLANEVAEFIGVAENGVFVGWVMLNYQPYNDTIAGKVLKVLAQGWVNAAGGLNRYATFDGGTMTVTKQGPGEGRYRLNFPSGWSLVAPTTGGAGNYIAQVGGYGFVGSYTATNQINATIVAFGSNYIDVITADDTSPNDGSWTFLITRL